MVAVSEMELAGGCDNGGREAFEAEYRGESRNAQRRARARLEPRQQ